MCTAAAADEIRSSSRVLAQTAERKRARNWVNLLTFALILRVCVCYSYSSRNDARDYEQRGKERPSIGDAFVIYARRVFYR